MGIDNTVAVAAALSGVLLLLGWLIGRQNVLRGLRWAASPFVYLYELGVRFLYRYPRYRWRRFRQARCPHTNAKAVWNHMGDTSYRCESCGAGTQDWLQGLLEERFKEDGIPIPWQRY